MRSTVRTDGEWLPHPSTETDPMQPEIPEERTEGLLPCGARRAVAQAITAAALRNAGRLRPRGAGGEMHSRGTRGHPRIWDPFPRLFPVREYPRENQTRKFVRFLKASTAPDPTR